MSLVRSSDECVQTPIDEYRHPETGSVIDVVSTVHIGEVRYYGQLLEHLRVRSDQGFVICLEGVAADENQAQPDRRTIKRGLMQETIALAGGVYQMVRASEGFADQSQLVVAMRRAGVESVKIDFSASELAERSSLLELIREHHSVSKAFKELAAVCDYETGVPRQIVYELISNAMAKSDKDHPFRLRRPKSTAVTSRNNHLMGYIDQRLEEDVGTNFATVWGYGHRHGLARAISARGYVNTGSSFVTVAHKTSP